MANEKQRDLVDRNAVLDQAYLYVMDGELVKMIDERAVMKLPKVDAVEVVRCKDCKHWTMGYCNNFACYDYEPTTNEDDFCSYGERREGNVE